MSLTMVTNANMYVVMQAMATVSRVIAVLVPDAAHAMQDLCQMSLQDYVVRVLLTPTLHLLARHHALHVCVAVYTFLFLF